MLLCTSLFAAELEVEADVPIELVIDGQVSARIYAPARVTLRQLNPGEHDLIVFRGGKGTPLKVTLPAEGRARLLVGKEALEVLDDAPAEPSSEATTASVEVRLSDGLDAALLTLGDQRIKLRSGAPAVLPALPPGEHRVEVRSADGTAIWARGELELQGGDELVIVISEGRAPEVFGSDRAWRPDR